MVRLISSVAVAASIALGVAPVNAHTGHGKQPQANVVKEQKPWGIAGDAGAVTRTIRVAMYDTMRFEPAAISVKQGETIRFVVKNEGKVMHEFVIGTKEENDKHAELMLKFPNMEHDEPYMAHVEPGKTGEIVWAFNRDGRFEFACLIAGHYQAGMVGMVDVSSPAPAQRAGAGHAHRHGAGHATGSADAPKADVAKADPAKADSVKNDAASAEGEVRRIDKEGGRITIRHGEIKGLDMPPMTMVFHVRDNAQLDGLQQGDKVRFDVVDERGRMVLTRIEAIR